MKEGVQLDRISAEKYAAMGGGSQAVREGCVMTATQTVGMVVVQSVRLKPASHVKGVHLKVLTCVSKFVETAGIVASMHVMMGIL